MLRKQGRRDDARQLLAPVYNLVFRGPRPRRPQGRQGPLEDARQARCLFITLGLLLAMRSVRVGPLPFYSLAAGFALTASAVAAFMVLQIRGFGALAARMAAD